jgi:hypothetical protein
LPIRDFSAFAIAAWEGDFYAFTSAANSARTRVDRYRPSDDSVALVATLSDTVVGVGVGPCELN